MGSNDVGRPVGHTRRSPAQGGTPNAKYRVCCGAVSTDGRPRQELRKGAPEGHPPTAAWLLPEGARSSAFARSARSAWSASSGCAVLTPFVRALPTERTYRPGSQGSTGPDWPGSAFVGRRDQHQRPTAKELAVSAVPGSLVGRYAAQREALTNLSAALHRTPDLRAASPLEWARPRTKGRGRAAHAQRCPIDRPFAAHRAARVNTDQSIGR